MTGRVLLLAGLVLILLSIPASAQDKPPGLDEVLGGFDEPELKKPVAKPPKKKNIPGSLEDALEGFGGQEAVEPGAPEALDDTLQGFGDETGAALDQEPTPELSQSPAPLPPDWLDLSGELTLLGIYNLAHNAPESGGTDHRGLSALQAKLRLQADVDLSKGWKARLAGYGFYDLAYTIKGRDGFTQEQLDSLESEVELTEVWLRGGLVSWLDIKWGRQIVVWGKSDNLRVTDVLNPLDARVPGLTDIEDLRLPVFMTRIDAYSGSWTLSGYIIHEPRFNKTAPYGSDFYLGGNAPPPPDSKPAWSLENQELALSLSGTFTGLDIALYGAYIFSDFGHLEFTSSGLTRRHERLYMAGAAANLVKGSWLIKSELAYFYGFEFANDPGASYKRSDIMLGLEYNGFTDTTISLEYALSWLWDFKEQLEKAPDSARQDDHRWALRLTRSFMHEELELTVLAAATGADLKGGGFIRTQLDYDWGHGLHIKGGVVFYQSGDRPPYTAVGGNHRMFLEFEYSF
jgi:hypothetical protein